MRLALLIPELIWPEPGDAAALGNLPCPALGALLARGRFMRDNSGDATFDAGIAACFGLESSAPYAALRLLGEELEGRVATRTAELAQANADLHRAKAAADQAKSPRSS